MDDKDNINYNVVTNQTAKKKKKRKKKKNSSKDSERNEAVIAMKNNIRQFWNNLPSSKRKELINIEKDNVLKRLKKAPATNDIDIFYDMYYEELENFLKDDENCRNEFFSTESDKFLKSNGNIHEKDIMPLIEESLLNEQKFKELAKKINKKNYTIDTEEDDDVDDYQNNSLSSDENESELKDIEDEENDNENKEVILIIKK
ncbi:hypothetical protein BCR36DRAFT_85491 [Piromyces finnis]|uniref:Uncharacterized protein n=1 Tax=Piromyces finnis TaxID=1754191 RepID=A0A1Y1V5P5_9FUNG|nr:hypothetical protein BCR36DRAFT_85491 [Piromyces finnis]|eukprot:ORX47871.1 hypothetical protein BCR36DRAFT_85491 [Piromyces finnis]